MNEEEEEDFPEDWFEDDGMARCKSPYCFCYTKCLYEICEECRANAHQG